MFNKILKAFKHPLWACGVILHRIPSLLKDDATFIKWEYYFGMRKFPNLEQPKTYNEKLQWLKLHNRKAEYTKMVDKYAVKEYVASIIGDEYIIPTLGIWNTPEEIEWNKLPNQFVLKTTHGGGNCGVIICKDKENINIQLITKQINRSLKQNLYATSREWPYKNVQKRIIAEPYMEDFQTQELRDYKFFCFDGEVKALFIGSERQRQKEPYFDFFDSQFNLLPIKQGHPNSINKPAKPKSFEGMKDIASKLSKDIPHVRVDLYEVNGKIYFGELTFFHFGGVVPFEPEEWDYTFGNWLTLPKKL